MSDDSLDPDLAKWLLRITPDSEPLTVEQARTRSRESNAEALARMSPLLVPAAEVDSEIPTENGPLPIRVLRPADSGPRPTIVYFHGGGWTVGDLDTHLGHARRICVQVGAVVVSVGYRLAPEHRFPAAYEDAVTATEWTAQRLAELGGDPDTLVVAGDSAGGQLAASVAIARRDAGQPLSGQLLLYPVTDVAGRYVDDQVNSHYMSRASSHQRFGLTLEGMATFARYYLDDDADSYDWRVSPMRAADVTGVAPAVIHTSTLDVLRTEGNFYADKLRAAGVEVIAREHPSLNHSYFGLGGVSAVADSAAAQAAEDLLDVLARTRV